MRSYTRRTADQWQSLINEQSESKLSAPEFCKQHNVGYASFCQWRKRLSEANQPLASFVALESPLSSPVQSHWAIELQLGPDVVLRIAKQ